LFGVRRWMFNEASGAHPEATRQRSPLTRAAAVALFAWFVVQRAAHNLIVDFSRVPISSALVHTDESAIVGYKVGCAVRLHGTGEWSPKEHFHARVVDIADGGEVVEVRYRSDGGKKRFRRLEFESLLTPMPAEGHYEVNMLVPLQRKGLIFKHCEWATIVDIRDSDETVKVLYRKGGHERFKRNEFERVLMRTPPWDQVHKEIAYHKLSTTIVTSFVGLAICHVLAVFSKYRVRAGLWTCYTAPFAHDFRCIGILLAVCTYMDSISMASLQATPCRVLDNFRLVLTALMMWMMVGAHARPTVMMWLALLSTTLSMVTLTLVQAKGEDVDRRPVDTITVLVVLSKVAIASGLASFGHLSFKRNRGMPLYAHLSQLFLTWGVATVAWSLVVEPRMMSSAEEFFRGWSRLTLVVALSSLAKICLTMMLLKYLDSILKSIGDIAAALALHCLHVALPTFSKRFEIESFLAMWVVVVSVVAYLLLREDHTRIVALHESIQKLRDPGDQRRSWAASADQAMSAIEESPSAAHTAAPASKSGLLAEFGEMGPMV